MGGGQFTGDPELAERVRALRAAGATYAQIKAELRVGASTISRILGVYGHGRARPRVTDGSRERARALRRDGKSVPEIARELGLARSTVWQLTKDIAWTPGPDGASRRAEAGRAYWRKERARRAEERERETSAAAAEVGDVSDRELLLMGAVAYWAEGSKRKPWNSDERLIFTNSDPDMILLYLEWLRSIGVAPERLQFRVHIHESADVRGAERYWADVVGVPVDTFARPSLKRHNARTVRKNVGSTYHGCLVVAVVRGAADYRHMEGVWRGLVRAVSRRRDASAP